MKTNTENLRQKMQGQLDAEKTQADRNKMGQFSTPFSLAVDIINSIMPTFPKGAIKFLEPAVGLGVFYSALKKCLKNRSHTAVGIEIDHHYAKPSQELWNDSQMRIIEADFFACDPLDSFNVLITNPPYVRHHHIDHDTKKRLQAMVKSQCGFGISGLAGLYCYFMMLTPRWMSDGGIMSFLVPSEFMDVNYGISVKRFLLEKVELLSIHKFDATDLQFDDALVSSCVVTYRNNQNATGHHVKFSIGSRVSCPDRTIEIPVSELRPKNKWTNYFKTGICTVHANTRIGDFFSVKRGIATGNNDYFIVSENDIREYNIPKKYLKPILPPPRHLQHTEIFSIDDIKVNGTMQFLFSCGDDETTLEAKYPSVWRYIRKGIDNHVNEGYICRNRKPWYYCPCNRPAPLVFPNMARVHRDGRAFRFILNNIHAIITNSYLALYPNPRIEKLLKDENILKCVWKALNDLPQDILSSGGRIYGGGLQKLEPSEVMNLPADTFSELLNSNKVETV